MLAHGNPQTVDRYWQAKQAAAWAVMEAKSSLVRFSAGAGKELLTSTGDIDGQTVKGI